MTDTHAHAHAHGPATTRPFIVIFVAAVHLHGHVVHRQLISSAA